jgi:NAD(P)-dependent dehydrogenase (short-subunit alcohol dehydrogenase family)
VDELQGNEKPSETDFLTGRAIEPQEVAKLFLFLASDDAALVSGSNYRMDGGMLMH